MLIQEAMDSLQRDIFNYNIDTVPVQLSDLMSVIIEKQAFDLNDIKKVQVFNMIMKSSLEALQNRDYLLLADLMEFKLKPILYTLN